MIIVGIGRAYHDCSICANINGVVKYAKWERELQQKHDKAPEWWFWKKLSEWGIELDKIDFMVETDGGATNEGSDKLLRLPFNGESKLKKHRNHYIMDHHLAHAWSITSFNKDFSAIIIDGRGSGGKSVMLYDKGKIIRSDRTTPGSVFSAIGRGLNLSKYIQDHAGKVMGLIPYGNINYNVFDVLKKYSPNNLYDMLLVVNLGETIPPDENSCSEELWKKRLDSLATINEVCYDFIRRHFNTVDKSKPIYYSGGVALNVDWNRRLLDEGYNVIVEPASYDGGLSIGCMRYACHLMNVEQPIIDNFPYIQDDEAPDSEPSEETIKKVAELLAAGKIVGWYQGHGELGPRALGNRSILMDPTVKDGKDILNSKVKHREWFRPFGASVKKDKASKYFDLDENPYMLFTANVIDKNLPAITHVDGTCRHQTVTVESNRLFYSLLDEFELITGLPVLLNTSLNLGGKPIAGKIEDAIELFNTTEMDALCVGNTLYIK